MIPSTFASGRLLAMRHPSFTSAELLERVTFDWQAFAVPLSLGIRDASWLTMLAIPKSCASLDAAEEMVGHLLSRDIQSLFASVGGNLPVRRSALSALVDADLDHVSNEALHRALSQSELSWPHMAIAYLGDSGIHNAMRECVAGRVPPAKVLGMLEDLLKRNSRSSK
jgi:ABC-type glycerol-3-phosphate transport system substrate-binding protein